jgi:hypothetical protein
MVMAVFDKEGSLAGVVHGELPSPQQLLDAGDRTAVYEHDYEGYLQRVLQVTPGMIRIKAFYLPEAELAVYELPECLQDLQDNPRDPRLAEEERKGLEKFFREWKGQEIPGK